MVDSVVQRDPVERLAEEFAARCRSGESPSVAEYAEQYPQYAEQILELFPAVAAMEQFRTVENSQRETVFKQQAHATPPQNIGDFRIIREIGRGGMGIVYEAEQRSLRRRVALKILPKHVLLAERHLRRFQREAQTAAQLHHTNIVPVFGVGEQDGLHYYVMQLIHGTGLDEVIRRPFIPDADHWQMVAQTGIQAAEALDYAHRQGTLHRDIKPSNLLVDCDDVVWVADFGLARAVDHPDASRAGEIVGTPRYMAPEQLQGAADARSDIYALGSTLYELLTGRPALAGATSTPDHGGRTMAGEPRRPRRIHRTIPTDLETVIMKCLAAEPSKRYSSAAALADDLQRFVDGRPIRARRASVAERTWRWCRRNPVLAAVSALAALLLVTVAFTAAGAYSRVQDAYAETSKAYTETKGALSRAEATSELAIDALDGIYEQLSPERIRVSAAPQDTDSGGPLAMEQTAMSVQASHETAALLDNLLVFYDRLAEQTPDDFKVTLQSAVASRRVGDIRQRLGQMDHAQREYDRAIEKLSALLSVRSSVSDAVSSAGIVVRTELARSHNELGNVHSARNEFRKAFQAHLAALAILKSIRDAEQPTEQYQYELARSMYFLAGKRLGGLRNRRGNEAAQSAGEPGPRHYRSSEYRDAAIEVLNSLTNEHPEAPDYRFLLALCHRQARFSHRWGRDVGNTADWDQAVQTLEELAAQYPDVADYRYELSVTDAEMHLGLFPWEKPTAAAPVAEECLLKALEQSSWLVVHNPTIAQYARSQTVILARLATVYRRTGRPSQAEDLFRQALERQHDVLVAFPDLPSHNQVLLEFFRLRLGQVQIELAAEAEDLAATRAAREQLECCVTNLSAHAQDPLLEHDRLLLAALPIAKDVLSD